MADRARWTGAGRGAPADAAVIAGMVLSLAAYYVVPAPLLCLPPLLVFGVLAWFRLEAALCLLPLTFPFWYVPKQVAGQVVFPLSEIVLAVCAAVALAQGARHLPALRHRLPRLARAPLGRSGPWLARAIPLALALAFTLARGQKRPRDMYSMASGAERWLAGVCALLCLPALMWSASRGAWVACVAGCAIIAGGWLWSAFSTRATRLRDAWRRRDRGWWRWGWVVAALGVLAGGLVVVWEPGGALAGPVAACPGGRGGGGGVVW